MRRGLWLVAATWWLLQLSACGDQPRAKAPVASHAGSTSGSRTTRKSGAVSGQVDGLEAPENSGETRESAHGAGAITSPTSDKLAERFGKTRALAAQQGSASYYGDSFAGRSTASGAPYQPDGFTAAHRSLPFGTVLRVTRSDGGQSVYVTVTDRGPYGPRGRIVDLSRAAAERLGMLRAGVVKIRLEVVEYGPRRPSKAKRRKR
ncbi:MAG TPA: septal ring lytic transglycosylase RlpA family protein [Polyangiaceae bacterium]|nr:septal ring lytic transglycosylase RlpA family protein [Polyangiaceae bacterium]